MRLAEKIINTFKTPSLREAVVLQIFGDTSDLMCEEPRLHNFAQMQKIPSFSMDAKNPIQVRGKTGVSVVMADVQSASLLRDFINKQAMNLTATVAKQLVAVDA